MKKYEGYDAKFADYETEIKGLKATALRNKIAIEKKLPLDAVEFLTGDDEESITAAADKLMKLSGSHSVGYTRNTEAPQGDSKEQQWRDFARSLQKN